MKIKTHNLHLFIPKNLNRKIERLARKNKMSKTEVVIVALRVFIEAEETSRLSLKKWQGNDYLLMQKETIESGITSGKVLYERR